MEIIILGVSMFTAIVLALVMVILFAKSKLVLQVTLRSALMAIQRKQ